MLETKVLPAASKILLGFLSRLGSLPWGRAQSRGTTDNFLLAQQLEPPFPKAPRFSPLRPYRWGLHSQHMAALVLRVGRQECTEPPPLLGPVVPTSGIGHLLRMFTGHHSVGGYISFP